MFYVIFKDGKRKHLSILCLLLCLLMLKLRVTKENR